MTQESPSSPDFNAPETKIVSSWRVACDGGEGALGHPRVWIEIPRDSGRAECGYCDAVYIHQSKNGQGAG